MDLDGTDRQYSKLTPDEKLRRREQGLCLYCGKPGHYANKCNKAQRPSKSSSLNATRKERPTRDVGILDRDDHQYYNSDSEVDPSEYDYCESDCDSGPKMYDYIGDPEGEGPTFQCRSGPSLPQRKAKRTGNANARTL